MRSKKPAAALRSPTFPPADDPFLVRPSQAPSSSAPFSSTAFDRYMMGQGETASGAPASATMAKEGSGGGLGKKLLSFPWTRSDKKHAAQQQQQIVTSQPPPSPTISSPIASSLQTTASLPMGFPAPPPLAGPAPRGQPSQHPSVAMFAPQHPQSNSSLSTIRTTSSFASTALFASSNDGWESEATSLSLTSSPESGRDSSGEGYAPRMWRVKGLKAERSTVLSDIAERDNEDARSSGCYDGVSPPSRRNSTPVPRMVAMMLADPETPPRPKRFSTSSIKPSPTSPPFDPAYEKAVAARRRQQSVEQESEADGEDADDEVSPPRQRRSMRKDRSEDDFLASSGPVSSFANTARIPSIRFEGISMDAVFAEVEKKLNKETSDSSIASFATASSDKKARRRSRVLSLYKPTSETRSSASPPAPKERELSHEFSSFDPVPSTSSLSSITESALSRTSSSMDLLRSESVTPTAAPALAPLDAPRPRPWPRRTSSRPSPLNVAAANAITSWGSPSAPLQAGSPLYSPPTYGVFSPVPYRSSPSQLVSPPLAGAFSPTKPTNSLSPTSSTSPTSPSLGEPFNPDPSPALSNASTFRPYDIPELLVCPPSPTQEEIDRTRLQEEQRKERRASVATMVQGATRVTVVQEKKMVRVSTRAPSRRQDRRTYVSPPLQQAATFSATSSRPASPAPTFDPAPSWDAEPAPPTPPTPTVVISPSFPAEPYNPPSVARTDFHPALSSLSVEQPSANGTDDDSSDCEESLHNMLMRLNRPHTPPDAASSEESTPPSTATPSLSLTELALELHTTSQSRLSMLAREMSATVSSSSSSSLSSAAKENRAPSPHALAPSPTSKRDRRLSKLYESDDSTAMQFGALRQQQDEDDDEQPVTMHVPQPLSPSMTHHSFALQSLHGDHGGRNFSSSSEEGDGEEGRFGELEMTLPEDEEPVEDDVDIESEIDKTLASIVGSASHSTFSSSSSSEPATSSPVSHTHKHGHQHHDSTSSFGSALSVEYLANDGQHGDGKARPFLPRSESLSSQLTDSSFDSAEAMDEGIVCLGERISCNYDVGVIGMAM
ncbi:hypothetical protein JCM6882_001409 [Rhodosporidiobolus microsporus]